MNSHCMIFVVVVVVGSDRGVYGYVGDIRRCCCCYQVLLLLQLLPPRTASLAKYIEKNTSFTDSWCYCYCYCWCMWCIEYSTSSPSFLRPYIWLYQTITVPSFCIDLVPKSTIIIVVLSMCPKYAHHHLFIVVFVASDPSNSYY